MLSYNFNRTLHILGFWIFLKSEHKQEKPEMQEKKDVIISLILIFKEDLKIWSYKSG